MYGALEFLEENKDELRWCSIEGYDVCPCKSKDVNGRLYYGEAYYKYWSSDMEQVTDNTDADTFIPVTI